MQNQGKVLKNAIRGKGLTQEAAAVLLGMTRQNLGLYFYKDILGDEFLQNVKDKLQIDISKETPTDLLEQGKGTLEQLKDKVIALLEEKVEAQEETIVILKEENASLKQEIDKRDKE